MAAAIKSMGLYDLLAPQFLAGFEIPAHIDEYLSLLAVTNLQSSADYDNVLYTGTVRFPSQPGSAPVLQHRDPRGRSLISTTYISIPIDNPASGLTLRAAGRRSPRQYPFRVCCNQADI
jgi:hypothetical protein